MLKKVAVSFLVAVLFLAGVIGPAQAQAPSFQYKSATLLLAQAANVSPTVPCGPQQNAPCTLDVSNATVATFQVTGTFSATINFDGGLDQTSFPQTLPCISLDTTTVVTSVTTTGIWRCNVNGLSTVRARISGYASGSVTVVANATTGMNTRLQLPGSSGVLISASVTPGSQSANTCAAQAFTVAGVTASDVPILVNYPTTGNATGYGTARASAANTIQQTVCNPTAGALTPASGTFTYLVLR